MNAVIVFDLNDPSKSDAVKIELSKIGYYAAWMADNIRYDLPSNCMWKVNLELSIAIKEIKNVIDTLNKTQGFSNLKLSKCIALSNTPWSGISNATVTPVS